MIKKGEARAPGYSEVTIEGYKEPMNPVSGGFGFYGAVTTTKDGEHIQCHICGYFFANLAGHVLYKHKIPVRDYKLNYGLKVMSGLISPNYRIRCQNNFNARVRPQAEYAAKAKEALAKARASGDYQPAPKWSAEYRNIKGRCKDQTIASIEYVANINNDRPTLKKFTETFGEGAVSTIKYWFGSWDAAVVAAGYQTARSIKAAIFNEKVEQGLLSIQDFYKRTGHTPQWSDFQTDPSLMHLKQLQKAFGTLNAARREAGVPELIKENGKWVEHV